MSVEVSVERLPAGVEATAYFVVTRRHVHIGDHNGWAVSQALSQQILGLAGLGDDVEPGFGE